MSLDRMIVVGDKLEQFADRPGVATVSALARILETDPCPPREIVVGQGVSDSWMQLLERLAERRGLDTAFIGAQALAGRASSQTSHKVRRENVLITEPVVVGEDRFAANLVIDDGCELMGDHQTGHHIQGMILIEASRQMFLAVIERFLRAGRPSYVVINSIDSAFSRFAFPLGVEITFTLKERIKEREERCGYDAEIAFSQDGECITTVRAVFTAFDKHVLEPKERAMADRAAEAALAASEAGADARAEVA